MLGGPGVIVYSLWNGRPCAASAGTRSGKTIIRTIVLTAF
jgi:hypothetical protein